jgi:hypothetical protein
MHPYNVFQERLTAAKGVITVELALEHIFWNSGKALQYDELARAYKQLLAKYKELESAQRQNQVVLDQHNSLDR